MNRATQGWFPQTGSLTETGRPAIRAVFLVGFMGAGKTSVGEVLGKKLGWRFEDLDELIERREKRSIEAIFRESGETAFRAAEHAALRQVLLDVASRSEVVALGGGAFVHSANARLLEESGFPSVFLDAPVEELFHRCQAQELARPLKGGQDEFRSLYESRRPAYLEALLRIDTQGKNLEEIATEIATNLGLGPVPDETGVAK
jgi:shikimate kinase